MDALEARDILTAKKIDERGYYLKAEMAKKNLQFFRKPSTLEPTSPFRYPPSSRLLPTTTTFTTFPYAQPIPTSASSLVHGFQQQQEKDMAGSPFNENCFLTSPPALPRDLLAQDDYPSLEPVQREEEEQQFTEDKPGKNWRFWVKFSSHSISFSS
jgi:hypothetical protein